MEIAYSIQDIEKRVSDIAMLTESYPVIAGSALRVHSFSYQNWGIGIDSENINWLFEKSENAYSSEWQDTDARSNQLVAQASLNAGLGDVNRLLNKAVAASAAEAVKAAIEKNGSFHLIDLGSGTGGTIAPLIKQLVRQGIMPKENSIISLVDPSSDRVCMALSAAHDACVRSPLAGKLAFQAVSTTDNHLLGEMGENMADVIISNAAIHHHAFNSHLPKIAKVLKEGAPFISGDWHNSMWECPARVYWLLYAFEKIDSAGELGGILSFVKSGENPPALSGSRALREYARYFGLSPEKIIGAFDGLHRDQRVANACIIRFWIEAAKIYSGENSKPPIFFLEAHERMSCRVYNFRRAGLGMEAQWKYTQYLKQRKLGSLAAVLAVRNDGKAAKDAAFRL